MSFEQVYNKHYRELFCFAHHLTNCKFQCEDLVHETFVRFYEENRKGVPIQNSRAWLYKVLLNLHKTTVSTDKRRSEKLQTIETSEISDDDINKQIADAEKKEIVMEALKGLEERDRHILGLYRRGLSYSEIAEVLEMNKTSVGTTLARAIEKLQQNLKKNYHELFE